MSASTLPAPARAQPRAGGFRPDIQALRALAVAGVLLTHLWPSGLTGGYVGVDVFFVISGYLITAHLLRELASTGRIDLAAFWARRIRRLLPAALLVIAVTLLILRIVVPYPVWTENAVQAIGAALYVENLELVDRAVDYMALDQEPSALQHYWSLSVEEQFYIAWPLLLVGTVVLAGRFRAARPFRAARRSRAARPFRAARRCGDGDASVEKRPVPVSPMSLNSVSLSPVSLGAVPLRAVTLALTGAVVLSLVASVVETQLAPERAYFVPWTRAWEFGAGALLAVAAARRAEPPMSRPPMSRPPVSRPLVRPRARPLVPRAFAPGLAGAGWTAIALAMVTYDATTAFPGATALLPVAGAAAVIAAGEDGNRTGLERVTSSRPVQELGDASYALYLWHWPLIVLAPYLVGGLVEHRLALGVAVGAVSVLLALATRRWVERPGQRWALLRRRRWSAYLAMLLAVMIVVAFAAGLVREADRRAGADADRVQEALGAPCVGARALEEDCGDPYAAEPIGLVSDADTDYTPHPDCVARTDSLVVGKHPERVDCDLGARPDAPAVWLIGDSHGEHWAPAAGRAAADGGWNLTVSAIGGCSPVAVSLESDVVSAGHQQRCVAWAQELDRTVRGEAPEVVVFSQSSHRPPIDDGTGRTQEEQYADALDELFAGWTARGTEVVVLTDTPRADEILSPHCTHRNLGHLDVCTAPREEATVPGPVETATDALVAEGAGDAGEPGHGGVQRIDLTDHICDERSCRAVVGGLHVTRDTNHLGAPYSWTLGPYLRGDLETAVPVLAR